MLVRVILVDVNPKMIAAWRSTFAEQNEIEVVSGSMLAQQVSAWVSPTNSKGNMDGGLDGVIRKHFGAKIEKSVKQEIARLYKGDIPVGHATCVETGADMPRYLISTPTMHQSSEDVSDTMNVALACCAAFQAVHMQNARVPGSIRSVALPGLGANTGKVPVEICSDLMWTAYDLFRKHEFTDFGEMRAALEDELGDLGSSDGKPGPTHGKAAQKSTTPQKPKPQAAASDFDDSEDDDDDEDEDDEDEDDDDDEDEDFDDH